MVTIKDIAKKTGYSHITVSRALNDSKSVKPETKEKIMTIAKELKYVPNEFARNLKLNKSNNVGLFFSSIHGGTTSYFFYQFFSKINSVANERFNIVVKGIDSYDGDFTKVLSQNYCGIILVSQSAEDDKFIEEMKNKDLPIVVVNRKTKVSGVVSIYVNEKKAIKEAVEYFILEGSSVVGLLKGNNDYSATLRREEGYYQALNENNIAIDKSLVQEGSFDVSSGYLGFKELINKNKNLDSLICMNDEIAVGALKAMKELKLNIPVFGFDNHVLGEYIGDGLNTIEKPIDKICESAVSYLIDLIDEVDFEKKDIEYDTKLIIRQK